MGVECADCRVAEAVPGDDLCEGCHGRAVRIALASPDEVDEAARQ